MVVARRYARALADQPADRDPQRLATVASVLRHAAEIFASDPAIARFFRDPSVPAEAKEKALATLAKESEAGETTGHFLRLLLRNERLPLLPRIAAAFEKIKDDRLGIVAVEATTAIPLTAPQTERFKESLETMTGRQVRLRLRVDPGVLGGARARIGSRVYDGTLRGRLDRLRHRLIAAG
jgi:F-type H+-transporting ATPase subunit delta